MTSQLEGRYAALRRAWRRRWTTILIVSLPLVSVVSLGLAAVPSTSRVESFETAMVLLKDRSAHEADQREALNYLARSRLEMDAALRTSQACSGELRNAARPAVHELLNELRERGNTESLRAADGTSNRQETLPSKK